MTDIGADHGPIFIEPQADILVLETGISCAKNFSSGQDEVDLGAGDEQVSFSIVTAPKEDLWSKEIYSEGENLLRDPADGPLMAI